MGVVTIRLNKVEQEQLNRAGLFLGVGKDRYGFTSEVIKKSIDFVNEFNIVVWEKFKNDYPHLTREFIKRRLVEG